jgi:hypothetical protein
MGASQSLPYEAPPSACRPLNYRANVCYAEEVMSGLGGRFLPILNGTASARAVLLRYNGPLYGRRYMRTLIAAVLPHHFPECGLPAQQLVNSANILDLAVCH